MLWQPKHMAVLASRVFAPCGAAGAGWAAAAGAAVGADAAGACACADKVTEATARAKSVVNNLFILRAQSGERSDFESTFDYIQPTLETSPARTAPHDP